MMNQVIYAPPPQYMRLTLHGMEKLRKLDTEIQALRHQQEVNSVDHSIAIASYEAERFNLLIAASAPANPCIELPTLSVDTSRRHPGSRRGSFSKSPKSGQTSRSPKSSSTFPQSPMQPQRHQQQIVQWRTMSNGHDVHHQKMMAAPVPRGFTPVYTAEPPTCPTPGYSTYSGYYSRHPQCFHQNSSLGQVRQKRNYNNDQSTKQEARRQPETHRKHEMSSQNPQIVVDVDTDDDDVGSRDSGYIEQKNPIQSQDQTEEIFVENEQAQKHKHHRLLSAFEALQTNDSDLDVTQEESASEQSENSEESCAKLEKASRKGSPIIQKQKREQGLLMSTAEEIDYAHQHKDVQVQQQVRQLNVEPTGMPSPRVVGLEQKGVYSAEKDESIMMPPMLTVPAEVQALSPQAQQWWYAAVQAHQASIHANAVHHAAVQTCNQGKTSAADLSKFAQCSYNASQAAHQASAAYESIKLYEQSQHIYHSQLNAHHPYQLQYYQQNYFPNQHMSHAGYNYSVQRNGANQRCRAESNQQSSGRSAVATARSVVSTSSSNSSFMENEWDTVNDIAKELKKATI